MTKTAQPISDRKPEKAPESSRHVTSWHVRVDVFEDGDNTTAHAVLVDEQAQPLEAHGSARRLPGQVSVPEIGDEVAVGRALKFLAARLLAGAAEDVAALSHEPVQPLS
jgi:Domain of unknown function (DUF1876)